VDDSRREFMVHDNAVKISTSNGRVPISWRGESAFSLVDSDDVVNRMKQQQ
jgi:hypothetical protein